MKLLLIVPTYPNKEQKGYQFVHTRVKEYKKQMEVEVFCLNKNFKNKYTYEGITVIGGSSKTLLTYISEKSFDFFAFHFFNIESSNFIKKYLKDKKVFVWFHGSDCVDCRRRFQKLKNVSLKKHLGYFKRKTLIYFANVLKIKNLKIINKMKYNCTFIFMSNWSHNTSEKDFNIKYNRYKIISNYIDSNFYKYHVKETNDRLKVLSIKSYASYVYGNDILQDVILEFSKYPEFKKFTFSIYGDGKLFEECTNKLTKFDNVFINKGILNSSEILEVQNKNGIFIYPKRGDSQGVSRCEAMSSGLVPIASDVEAISEFLPKNTGYLVKTIQDFIDTLLFVYKNPDDFLNKSEAASEYIKKRLSYDNTIKKEIDMFMEELK